MSNPKIDLVLLDPVLQNTDPNRFMALFRQFSAGYAAYFSGDEAESTDEWLPRFVGRQPRQPVMRILVAVDSSGGQERVIGGLACEFYRASRCVLATYIYVLDEERYRRKHHARALIALAPGAFAEYGTALAIFAEAEWPEALRAQRADNRDVAAARRRLAFFARLDARVLNIDYVQPSLASNKESVSWLRLLWIPPSDTPDTSPPDDDRLAQITASFLTEFYTALSEATSVPSDLSALNRQCDQLMRHRPLTRPLPRLMLTDIAICLHFVEHLEENADTTALLQYVQDDKAKCPVFHSMETDLLSRAYRTSRPFRTMCLTKPLLSLPSPDAAIPITILFPDRITFRSENRIEERRWTLRHRSTRAYLAFSLFFDARVLIWHLTLTPDLEGPDATQWFDEVDLIALLKLADDAADQEFLRVGPPDSDIRIGDGIRFRLTEEPGTELDAIGLLRAVASIACRRLGDGIQPQDVSLPTGATVELLNWNNINSTQPYYGIADQRTREAICGIVTSIFDFQALDNAEATDTLTASVPLETSLVRAHRQNLVHVGSHDRAAAAVAGSFGISPYLVIPHAVTLCNEAVLQRFERSAATGRGERSVTRLSARVGELEAALRWQWVSNPFFYQTEQSLYRQALRDSGVRARHLRAESLLRELKTRLQLLRKVQRGRFEAFAAGALGAISVAGFDTLLIDTAGWLKEQPWLKAYWPSVSHFDKALVGHALTLGAAIVLGLAFFAWKRPQRDIRIQVNGQDARSASESP